MDFLKEQVAFTLVILHHIALLHNHHLQVKVAEDQQGVRINHLFQRGWIL